jgi:hypothetical protein
MGRRSGSHPKSIGEPGGSRQESSGESKLWCNHTLHLVDSAGNQTGSWIGEKSRFGTRFSCPHCGKFYGYLPKNGPRAFVSSGESSRE